MRRSWTSTIVISSMMSLVGTALMADDLSVGAPVSFDGALVDRQAFPNVGIGPGHPRSDWPLLPPPGIPGFPFSHPGPEDVVRFAGRIAAVETLVGIRSAQLDSWRAYSSALVDLFVETCPKHQCIQDTSSKAATAPVAEDGQGKLLSETFADQKVRSGEKAKQLMDALQALRTVLTPEQMDRLRRADAEGALLPQPLFGPSSIGVTPRPPFRPLDREPG